jgi:hypothetical protein
VPPGTIYDIKLFLHAFMPHIPLLEGHREDKTRVKEHRRVSILLCVCVCACDCLHSCICEHVGVMELEAELRTGGSRYKLQLAGRIPHEGLQRPCHPGIFLHGVYWLLVHGNENHSHPT